MRYWCLIPAAFLAISALAEPIAEEERLVFADGLYARGMHELAIKEYESFLRDFPETDKADVVCFRLGESFRQIKNYIAAEKQFRQVFYGFPNSPHRMTAGYRRAELFMKIEQYDAAVDLFKVVLQLDPPGDVSSASLYLMGDSLLSLGKTEEARQVLGQVVERHPDSTFFSYALLKLGETYVAAGEDATDADRATALGLYQRAADKPASDRVGAEALFQIAELHFLNKAFQQSAAAYHTLLTRHPNDLRSADAKLQAAWASHNAGLYAEALRLTDEAVTQAAGSPTVQAEWLYLKANCERQLMKGDQAVVSYARLIAEFPKSRFAGAARYEKALASYRSGKFDEAIEEARNIGQAGDLKKDVYWLLAESFSALGRKDEAIQYYRLLAREFPDSERADDASYRLAHDLQTQGKFEEAARYFGMVAEKSPESKLAPQALFASAYCHAKEDMYAEAVRDWSALVRKYPADLLVEESLYQKGMGEIRLKRDGDALASLRELLTKFPKTRFAAEALYWQGMLLRDDGKMADAETVFRAALAAKPREELAREATFYLAAALYDAGTFEEAADLFQALLSSPLIDRFTPALLRWLAEYRHGQGKFGEAVESAALLIAGAQEASWHQIGWCLVGRSRLAQDKSDEAEAAFRNALGVEVRTAYAAEAALRLGEIALANVKFEEAVQYLSTAAQMATGEESLGVRAHAYAGLGRAAEGQSDAAAAARYYMSVAILYDDAALVSECLYKAAAAFGRAGDPAGAQKAARELVARYADSEWAAKPDIVAVTQPEAAATDAGKTD